MLDAFPFGPLHTIGRTRNEEKERERERVAEREVWRKNAFSSERQNAHFASQDRIQLKPV